MHKKVSFIVLALISITLVSGYFVKHNNYYYNKELTTKTTIVYDNINELRKNHKHCSANYNHIASINYSNILIATKHLKKKFAFAKNLFKNANSFEFFESIILFDKKIVTHLADNCQLLKR